MPGAEPVVSGAGIERVFDVVDVGASANLAGLEITGGEDVYGGGILNRGSLSLSGVTLTANHAASFGGAIDNSGTMVIADSVIERNSSDAFAERSTTVAPTPA